MIKIESVHIREFRGIRDLTLRMNKGSFAISGPNGSGKSGVVDAIQFALSGDIGRLTGPGTGDLKLSEHGPHVEKRDDPGACFVRLDVYFPSLNKFASITRNVKKPKQPEITPNDPAVRAAFEYVAQHREITLSRRDIIKLIVTEATQRSRDVQTLLKLDEIDETRALLKTTENRLNKDFSIASSQAEDAENSLKRHLDVPALKGEDILRVVNQRRKVLELAPITELAKDTVLSEGLGEGGKHAASEQPKESVLADLRALEDALNGAIQTQTASSATLLVADIAAINADPALLPSIKQHGFLELGLSLVAGPECPLCDARWHIDQLREHLRQKLERSKRAQIVHDRMVKAAQAIISGVARLKSLGALVITLPETPKEFAAQLGQWSGELTLFGESIARIDGMIAAENRLASGWLEVDPSMLESLKTVSEKVAARPDRSSAATASGFLTVAQDRLNTLRLARRNREKKKAILELGRTAYKTYIHVSEGTLTNLYKQVEEEFAAYYRFINQDDEGEFKAQFEASDGKLGLLVDFHRRGMFPPGAYHSEGHQDGMGVCLYLALMKRVLGSEFTIAVLDDVVMSVDSHHRKQFCKLLKSAFPGTQFVITTHDPVWAKQLRSEGVVGSKSAVAFHTWTVETGPVLDEVAEVWDQIEADLAKNEVPAAAARLRRHLEYVASDLADELGAKVTYKADGGYDLGELLNAVIGRQGELLKLAAKAAKSWGDEEQEAKVAGLQKRRAEITAEQSGEQWAINKVVHYNELYVLSRNDFKPVVDTFKGLLEQFRCTKAQCNSWLSLVPRHEPTDLRCHCGAFRLNLKERSGPAAKAMGDGRSLPLQ